MLEDSKDGGRGVRDRKRRTDPYLEAHFSNIFDGEGGRNIINTENTEVTEPHPGKPRPSPVFRRPLGNLTLADYIYKMQA